MGMVAWALTFLVVGLVAAPVLVRAAGLTVRRTRDEPSDDVPCFCVAEHPSSVPCRT